MNSDSDGYMLKEIEGVGGRASGRASREWSDQITGGERATIKTSMKSPNQFKDNEHQPKQTRVYQTVWKPSRRDIATVEEA
uniref:Uncharacterized protein n=1 Tax=Steinernema glaseri TaxID=37863 RepID=A0A1I7YL81_9BILA